MIHAESQLNVLALNSGSSSLEFGLYGVGPSRIERLLSGEANQLAIKAGSSMRRIRTETRCSRRQDPIQSRREALIRIGRLLVDSQNADANAIGHRIVHGGPSLRQHCLIDDPVLARTRGSTAFAPLHIPSALSVIRFAQEHFRGVPQVACFDTTFHVRLPEVARVLPVARELQGRNSALRISRPFM